MNPKSSVAIKCGNCKAVMVVAGNLFEINKALGHDHTCPVCKEKTAAILDIEDMMKVFNKKPKAVSLEKYLSKMQENKTPDLKKALLEIKGNPVNKLVGDFSDGKFYLKKMLIGDKVLDFGASTKGLAVVWRVTDGK